MNLETHLGPQAPFQSQRDPSNNSPHNRRPKANVLEFECWPQRVEEPSFTHAHTHTQRFIPTLIHLLQRATSAAPIDTGMYKPCCSREPTIYGERRRNVLLWGLPNPSCWLQDDLVCLKLPTYEYVKCVCSLGSIVEWAAYATWRSTLHKMLIINWIWCLIGH